MKIDDIIKKSSEHFPVKDLTCTDLKAVFDFLTNIGYNEKNVIEKLRIEDLDDISIQRLDYYLKVRLKENSRLDQTIKLFLLCYSITVDEALEAFGDTLLELMISVKLLEKRENIIISPVDLFPVRGFFIATDHVFSSLSVRKKVYPLMGDSLCLARAITEENVDSSLDICTGSGVQAIVASKYSRKVVGVDVNPRALNFARFNALLNQVENVEFRQGNLYEAVKDEKFDRITANPPFVPSPDSALYYRDGAETGEFILEKIISGLPQYLNETGTCQVVSLLVFTGGEYNAKIKRWLNFLPFHVLTLYGTFLSVETYINMHFDYCTNSPDFHMEKVNLWADSYKKAGIEMLSQGLINIKRSSHNMPFSEMKCFRSSAHSGCRDEITVWLNTVESMKDMDYIESLINKDFVVSPKVDYITEFQAPGKQSQLGVFFRDDSAYMNHPVTPEAKIIIDYIIDSKNSCKKTDFNMVFSKHGSTNFNKDNISIALFNLIKDNILLLRR
jgi:carbamoyltransferase